MKTLKKQLRLTNQDFYQYLKNLTPGELRGLNYKLELDPMPLTYFINGDCYVKYLHEVKRGGQTLVVGFKEKEETDEDGFLVNEYDYFTFRSAKGIYLKKGYNFGSLNFNEAVEYRSPEF